MAIWCWRVATKRRHIRLCVAILLAIVFLPYLALPRVGEDTVQTVLDFRTPSPPWKKRSNGPGEARTTSHTQKLSSLIEELTAQKNLLIEEYRKISGKEYRGGNDSHPDEKDVVSAPTIQESGVNETLHVQPRGVADNSTKLSMHLEEVHSDSSLLKLLTNDLPQMMNCADINQIKLKRRLGSGTSKEVHLGQYKGTTVAVKRVTGSVEDVKACIRRKKFWKQSDCYLYANYKVMKEILLGLQLQHPNILKLLGFCVRNEQTSPSLQDHGVVSVTEVGGHVKVSDIKALSWSQRLKLALEISSLLDYLEHSTLGSLIITDFKLDQMFFVGSSFKLGDMDDMNNIEGECKKDGCWMAKKNCGRCVIEEKVLDIPCVGDRCPGLNAKFNLYKFNEKIFPTVFEGPPRSLSAEVTHLRNRLQKLDITAAELYYKVLSLQNQTKILNGA